MGGRRDSSIQATAKTARHGRTSMHLYNLLYEGNFMHKKNKGKVTSCSSLSVETLPPAERPEEWHSKKLFFSSPNSTILRHGTKGPGHGHSSLMGPGNPSCSVTHDLSHCGVASHRTAFPVLLDQPAASLEKQLLCVPR